ncbi:flagellar hook-basal body complex protein [Salmonella enterica]|nr:flagellar hook-basal body complex protein [Salmonella enterica]
MDHAIYTAMGAASAALNRQAVTADNLANLSTPGFRALIATNRFVPVVGPTSETRALVAVSTPGNDSTPGVIESTGRDLDVALPTDAWLSVELPDGSEGFTRNGKIEINNDGALLIKNRPLLGDGGPITVAPQAKLTIASDGTITALGAGDKPSALAQVGKLKVIKAGIEDLLHGDDGFFHLSDSMTATPYTEVKLMPGMLEGSNVSSVQSMVDMIDTARHFDMNMKVISTVDEDERNANQLLTIS